MSIETNPPVPPSKVSTKWANFGERVVWTLLQAASAEVLLAGYEQLRGPLESSQHGLWLVLLTTILSAIKNAAAQAFGSPTGATLSSDYAPVPAEDVVAKATESGGVVAATGSTFDNGTPVVVEGYVGEHEGGSTDDTPAGG